MKSGLRAVGGALKTHAFMAAGFALAGMVVGAFTAGPAIAQAVGAALVSNVDDPGRIPYTNVQNLLAGSNCGDGCVGEGSRLVPAGKRLVITNVTGEVDTPAPGGSEIILKISTLTSGNTLKRDATIPMIFSGSAGGLNSFGFNQQVLLSYDAGPGPLVALRVGGAGSNFQVVLSGYLLDCATGPCAALP